MEANGEQFFFNLFESRSILAAGFSYSVAGAGNGKAEVELEPRTERFEQGGETLLVRSTHAWFQICFQAMRYLATQRLKLCWK